MHQYIDSLRDANKQIMSYVFIIIVIHTEHIDYGAVRRRIRIKDCLNAFIYNSEGMTKIRKISIEGVNEMKYAPRYNHKFSDVFAQPGSNEMIRRGNDKTIKTIGLMINCLCSLNCC
jgi:hypothetical protein